VKTTESGEGDHRLEIAAIEESYNAGVGECINVIYESNLAAFL
jgi:hypothetical protein